MQAVSPMMQQYFDIKAKHQDCILFFRLGDFYEMFFDDAALASIELSLTLTGRNYGQDERAPMCGVPFHSADSYIAKLIEKGHKVAICEQVEDPASAKGIVKREVVRIVTPGTVTSQSMLDEKENNYLVSVYDAPGGIGMACCDVSTGELRVTQAAPSNRAWTVSSELDRANAREVLINEGARPLDYPEALISVLGESCYNLKTAENTVLRQFGAQSLEGICLLGKDAALLALGALLSYLFETQKQSLSHLSTISYYETGHRMSLDKSTMKNLELTETLFDKKLSGSLLWVLDKTRTAMGSRKMKQWLREPLNDLDGINERLDAVETLTDDTILRNNVRESLKRVHDLERLSGRVSCGSANGKDLLALKNSIYQLPAVKEDLARCGCPLLENLEGQVNPFREIYELIESAVAEDAPFTVREGGLIKEGYSQELDGLKFSIKDGQTWIASLEGAERERTGIKNLKVGFNKVFGYYLEITKSYFDMIPENYIRKQTLANCERFITPELKEMESLVLNAEAKINQKEYELFAEIRKCVEGFVPEIQKTAAALASIDVLGAFAEAGAKLGYVKPSVHDGKEIAIRAGRHPVIEQTIKNGVFVSNDAYLDGSSASMLLITGPNMSGKSTYMRQTALIVLMAQSGCFVPCESASIGIVDRIFTRIGASDNLSLGQSTFYVEMSELAYILNASTEKSLIILDEIGRGTSTYDGLSIAWSVAEHLCGKKNRVRALFATHYHELTTLEGCLPGFKNLNVDVSEEGGSVVFLHKIVEGSASRSYGIHVAQLAGVPQAVLARAAEKLSELEKSAQNIDLSKYETEGKSREEQISFFSFAPNPVVERLKNLDLMELTPSEAFKILEELKEAANDQGA
ncbi:MAG: DNA mismatch repair protein MutS [Clostridiales bacterium]|nr:DNA mismatch repair protein MutS [Clostridiales bacterium]